MSERRWTHLARVRFKCSYDAPDETSAKFNLGSHFMTFLIQSFRNVESSHQVCHDRPRTCVREVPARANPTSIFYQRLKFEPRYAAHRLPKPNMTVKGSRRVGSSRYRSGLNMSGWGQSCKIALDKKLGTVAEKGEKIRQNICEDGCSCWNEEVSIIIILHQSMRHSQGY
jgi:hypothetical protein